MQVVKGWWFAPKNKKLANGDNRIIRIGATHKVRGEITPCQFGLHLSPKIIDALKYAPGPVIYKVKGSGKIVPHGEPVDKYACSERTYLSGGVDVSEILRKFARMCALDVIHLWDAPDVVVKYLKTGNEKIRDAARDAAWAAVGNAAGAARDATWTARAARDAARDAAWDARAAVGDAARAARAAVGAAARAAAWDPAWDAAWDAVGDAQNRRLTRMVNRRIKNAK